MKTALLCLAMLSSGCSSKTVTQLKQESKVEYVEPVYHNCKTKWVFIGGYHDEWQYKRVSPEGKINTFASLWTNNQGSFSILYTTDSARESKSEGSYETFEQAKAAVEKEYKKGAN